MIVDVEGSGSGFVPKASVMVREGYFGFLDLPSSPEEIERFIRVVVLDKVGIRTLINAVD